MQYIPATIRPHDERPAGCFGQWVNPFTLFHDCREFRPKFQNVYRLKTMAYLNVSPQNNKKQKKNHVKIPICCGDINDFVCGNNRSFEN